MSSTFLKIFSHKNAAPELIRDGILILSASRNSGPSFNG